MGHGATGWLAWLAGASSITPSGNTRSCKHVLRVDSQAFNPGCDGMPALHQGPTTIISRSIAPHLKDAPLNAKFRQHKHRSMHQRILQALKCRAGRRSILFQYAGSQCRAKVSIASCALAVRPGKIEQRHL